EADPQRILSDQTQVDTGIQRGLINGLLVITHLHSDGVEELAVNQAEALRLQGSRCNGGEAVDAGGNALETFGSVINGVEHAHDSQQNLKGTDVGVSFLAADVLFTGLHVNTQGLLDAGIDGHPDNTAGC